MNKLWVKILSITLCLGVFVGCILLAALLGGAPDFTIDTSEARTNFLVGEDFTYDGLVGMQGDKSVKDFKVDSSAFDKTKSGEYQITVTYRTYEQSYKVNVYTKDEFWANMKTIGADIGENMYCDGGQISQMVIKGEDFYLLSKDDEGKTMFEVWYENGVWCKDGIKETLNKDGFVTKFNETFVGSDYDGSMPLAQYQYNKAIILLFDLNYGKIEWKEGAFDMTLDTQEEMYQGITLSVQDFKVAKFTQTTAEETYTMNYSYTPHTIPPMPEDAA